jgi:transposase
LANKIPYSRQDKKSCIVYSPRRERACAAEMVGIKMYVKIQELKELGYKKLRTARQLNIDTKTVRKYWDMTEGEYLAYLDEAKERSKIMDPYRDYVMERLLTHPEISSAIIYDNLRETFSNFAPSYRSVRLFVCTLREKEGIPVPAKLRQYGENPELPFGFQAQVDTGQKIMKDANGKAVRIYVFAMVLAASRQKYVYYQLEPFTAQTFIEAHDRAFRYFGGRPVEIVYDQDRIMVVSENGGDIILTEKFENYKHFAGFSIHLCRGYDPESKGKVEAVVKYVKSNFLACRIFQGLARLNSDGLQWLDRTGNGLVHETTKMVPKIVFAEEQKHLKPVPELSQPQIPKIAIVRKTNVVMYRQNRYCLPAGTYQPGKKVRIETDEDAGIIRFFDLKDRQMIEEYPIAAGIGRCIRNRHPERDKFTQYQELKEKVIARLGEDEQSRTFIETMLALKPRYTRDQLSVVTKLQDKYTKGELGKAISYCMERNLFSACDLRDTLDYFGQKKEPALTGEVRLPLKYSLVIAQTRPIDAYAVLTGGTPE